MSNPNLKISITKNDETWSPPDKSNMELGQNNINSNSNSNS